MMGGDGKSKNSKLFFYILKDNLFGIGKYLFLGIFIASLIKVFVPPSIKVSALPHVKPTSVRALAIGTSSPEHTYIGTDIKDIRG